MLRLPIISLAIGLLLGALPSWKITSWYYTTKENKQTKIDYKELGDSFANFKKSISGKLSIYKSALDAGLRISQIVAKKNDESVRLKHEQILQYRLQIDELSKKLLDSDISDCKLSRHTQCVLAQLTKIANGELPGNTRNAEDSCSNNSP